MQYRANHIVIKIHAVKNNNYSSNKIVVSETAAGCDIYQV